MNRGFWSKLFQPGPISGQSKFTFEELQNLYGVLQRNPTVTEANRAVVVETIRSIAEFIIWGDQNEPRIFDFFLENNIMLYLHRVLQQPANRTGDVAKQVLQTLSIIIQNIRSETGIYFLFSNNHINNIVEIRFDFEDEEVLGYYISFLKTISLKLNPRTVQFFFDSKHGATTFPLYAEAAKFAHHKEGMVRAGVRTLTLNVYSVDDPSIQMFVTLPPATGYFYEMSNYVAEQIRILDRRLQTAESYGQQVLSSLDSQIAEVEDMLAYCADILTTGSPALAPIVAQQLWVTLVGPMLLRPLVESNTAAACSNSNPLSETTHPAAAPGSVRPACALYVLERIFQLFEYTPFLHNLLLALLGEIGSLYGSLSAGASNHAAGLLGLSASPAHVASRRRSSALGLQPCRSAVFAFLASGDPRTVPATLRMLVAATNNRAIAPEVLHAVGLLPVKRQGELHDSARATACASCLMEAQYTQQQLQPSTSGAGAGGEAAAISGPVRTLVGDLSFPYLGLWEHPAPAPQRSMAERADALRLHPPTERGAAPTAPPPAPLPPPAASSPPTSNPLADGLDLGRGDADNGAAAAGDAVPHAGGAPVLVREPSVPQLGTPTELQPLTEGAGGSEAAVCTGVPTAVMLNYARPPSLPEHGPAFLHGPSAAGSSFHSEAAGGVATGASLSSGPQVLDRDAEHSNTAFKSSVASSLPLHEGSALGLADTSAQGEEAGTSSENAQPAQPKQLLKGTSDHTPVPTVAVFHPLHDPAPESTLPIELDAVVEPQTTPEEQRQALAAEQVPSPASTPLVPSSQQPPPPPPAANLAAAPPLSASLDPQHQQLQQPPGPGAWEPAPAVPLPPPTPPCPRHGVGALPSPALRAWVDALFPLLAFPLLPIPGLWQLGHLLQQLAPPLSGTSPALERHQREHLRAALSAAVAGVLEELGHMWCEAIFPLICLEWPLALDGMARPALPTRGDLLVGGPVLYPRNRGKISLATPGRLEMGLSNSAISALHTHHNVQRLVALTQICQQLCAGSVGREPPLPAMEDMDARLLDVNENQQCELSAAASIPCIVSFAPGQERRVYFALSGAALTHVADYSSKDSPAPVGAAESLASADSVTQAALLHSSPAVVLADPAPTRLNAGIVLSVAPLLGCDPLVDKTVGKWLHVHVRPSVRGLLRVLRSASSRKGGALVAMRQLADGHWVLAFPDAERAANARMLVEQAVHKLRALYCEMLNPVLALTADL